MYAEVTPGWNVFKQIFTEHWEGFKPFRPRYNTPYYDDLVDKMLRCGNPDQIGYIEYRCLHCGQGKHRVAMSCKSSLCLRCAKVYVDHWVAQVGKMLHDGVIYRHIVLTVPDVLRTPFYQHAEALLSPFMQCGVQCLDDFFSTVSGKALKGGYIVVVQTHGRNGQYNPHLHIIATSGGWDAQAHKWVHLGYLPYPMLHKKWQWYALEMCRETLKTDAMARLVKTCYDKYPNGFVANVQKGDVPSRYQSLATYLAKYVVSPPISLRRIDGYDGQSVTYHYRSHKTERVERETRGCLHLYRSDDSACVSERFPTDTLLRGAGDQDVCQDQRPDSGGLGEGQGHRQGCHQDHRAAELSGTLPSKFRSRSVALSALPP